MPQLEISSLELIGMKRDLRMMISHFPLSCPLEEGIVSRHEGDESDISNGVSPLLGLQLHASCLQYLETYTSENLMMNILGTGCQSIQVTDPVAK
ncbi:hypothetical protein HAX54_003845 [Datura stramonium]|uniref:Uncharacterized protein n=1 Tax=Datura stramonium TaxID=4076 RepID=A0ABS8T602_DATST|nr:hypothetical protein [Datura stramonium]